MLREHWGRGKQNSLFPAGPVIKGCSNSKIEKNCEEIVCLTSNGSQICRGFKEHDLITASRKFKLLFPWGVSEFCSPLGVLTHDTWHVLLQSENVFKLGGITMIFKDLSVLVVLCREVKAAKYKKQKPWTYRATLFRCKFWVDVSRFSLCVINLSRNKNICCWLKKILITKVFDKKLRIKSSHIKEWRFDGSMPSFSNSNKIRYLSSLYSECTCQGLSAYD